MALRISAFVTLGGCAALVYTQAFALDVLSTVGYSAEYNDNATRVASEQVDEFIHRPTANLLLTHDVAGLQATADYSITRQIFSESSFQDETLVEGKGLLSWSTSRDLLQLNLENYRSRRTLDSSENNTPDNQQLVDQTIADATIQVNPLSNHRLRGTMRIEGIDAEESETNSERWSYIVGYEIPQPREGKIGIEASYTYVDFDDPLSPDYNSESVQLIWLNTMGRLTVDSRLGYAEIDRSQSREDFDQFTGRVGLGWELSETSSVSLAFSRNVEDNTLNQPALAVGTFRDQVVDNSAINEIFIDSRATFGYEGRIGKNELAFTVFRAEVDYLDSLLDEERTGATLRVSRQLSSRFGVNFTAGKTEYDFVDEGRQDDELDLEINFDYQANRRLSFGLALGRFTDKTTLVNDPDVEALSAILSVEYVLFGDAAAR